MTGLTVPVLGFTSGKLHFLEMSVGSVERLPAGSILRFGVGLGSGDTARIIGPGGDVPKIRLFDENGKKVASAKWPGYIISGSVRHISMLHKDDVQTQSSYAVFATGNDPICVAHLAITWPDGSKYGWVGDWGRHCGHPWYYSNVYVPGTDVKVDCMWLDKGRSLGGFQVHFPDFSGKHNTTLPKDAAGEKRLIDWYCKSGPPFRTTKSYPNEVVYWKGPRPPFDRGEGDHVSVGATNITTPEEDIMADSEAAAVPQEAVTPVLIISDAEQHSVEDLCNSETSSGPDLLNLYSKMFCRMSDKTIWPVCDAVVNVTENCFNTSRNILSTTEITAAAFSYGNVFNWTEGLHFN